MTHKDLIPIAAKWLAAKHPVVITELATLGEEPDAIGWQSGYSTLIECKATRSDFLSDRDKSFRRGYIPGIGAYRYYLAPAGIIGVSDLPPQWGLLEVTGQRVRLMKHSESFHDVNHGQEIRILLSCIRRIGHSAPTGVSIRCYTIDSLCRATLGVADAEAE